MRNGLLALAALAATTLTTVPTADACGVPEPQVLLLSSHMITKGPSSFAILDERVPQGLLWTRLAPHSYDGTEIAAGSVFGPAVQLSLVGPRSAQRFNAKDRFFLRNTFTRRDEHAAMAVPAGDFRIAIVGEHDDKARFLELDQRAETSKDAIWVAKQGLNAYNSFISIAPIRSSRFEAITVTARNDGKTVTLIRSGEGLRERVDGTVIGGLSFHGMTFALVLEENTLRALAL
jgi:hypothetical protein